jgi:hypothetical protein
LVITITVLVDRVEQVVRHIEQGGSDIAALVHFLGPPVDATLIALHHRPGQLRPDDLLALWRDGRSL